MNGDKVMNIGNIIVKWNFLGKFGKKYRYFVI